MVSTAGWGEGPEKDGRTSFAGFLTDNLELARSVPLDPVPNPGEPGVLILEAGLCQCPVQNNNECGVRKGIQATRSVTRGQYMKGRMTGEYILIQRQKYLRVGRGGAALLECDAGPNEGQTFLSFVVYVGPVAY